MRILSQHANPVKTKFLSKKYTLSLLRGLGILLIIGGVVLLKIGH